jgi:hypothetical protein
MTCGTALYEGDSFCGRCGARAVGPSSCPACEVELRPGARFCHACGVRVVGARPGQDVPLPELDEQQVDLQDAKGSLPKAAPARSNVGGNVLVFVAVVAVLLVVIYAMNRDKPKEATMFSGAPPAEAPVATPSGEPPVPSGPTVAGEVVLGEGVEAPADAVLFITARPSGARGGPPLAVRRLDPEAFPAAFSLGPSDVMIAGRPWKGPIDLTARLDQDGDALSRSPGDLATPSPVSGVELGATGVRVILAPEEGR